MIALLRGRLVAKEPGVAIVDVGGVGYRVHIPLSTYYELGEDGAEVTLRIHTHVREDALALYGFRTPVEEALFDRLIAVAGVGPALALKVLSGLEPRELVAAIRAGDLRRLSSIPGVGRKTAERIVVELRDKMPALAAAGEEGGAPEAAAPELALREDLLSALTNLGYPRKHAEKAVAEALRDEPGVSFDVALKKVLRRLAE